MLNWAFFGHKVSENGDNYYFSEVIVAKYHERSSKELDKSNKRSAILNVVDAADTFKFNYYVKLDVKDSITNTNFIVMVSYKLPDSG